MLSNLDVAVVLLALGERIDKPCPSGPDHAGSSFLHSDLSRLAHGLTDDLVVEIYHPERAL